MKSLFLKIFLSYWVAQALFVALAILITVAVRERGESAAWDAQQAAVLDKAVQTYEQSGPTEARRYFEEVRDSFHVRAYLLDDHGQDISGRELPRWAESLGKGVEPPRRDFWQRVTPSPFRRQVQVAASGHRYTLVAFLPPERAFRARRRSRPEHSYRNYFVGPGLLFAGAIPDRAGGPPARCHAASGGRRSERPGGRPRGPAPRRDGAVSARFRHHGGTPGSCSPRPGAIAQ